MKFWEYKKFKDQGTQNDWNQTINTTINRIIFENELIKPIFKIPNKFKNIFDSLLIKPYKDNYEFIETDNNVILIGDEKLLITESLK